LINANLEGVLGSSKEDLDDYLQFLLSRIDAATPVSRHLAYLTLARIIYMSKGEQQITIASQVMDHLEPIRSGKRLADYEGMDRPKGTSYIEAIITNLESKKLTGRGQAMLLSSLATVKKPHDGQITWLEEKVGTR
jgi:hypothetical protein